MPKEIPLLDQPGYPYLTLLEDAEVTMTTFGNKETFVQDKGYIYKFDILVTRNAWYTTIQCGLNYYTLPTVKCVFSQRTDKPADPHAKGIVGYRPGMNDTEKAKAGGIWVDDVHINVPPNATIVITLPALFDASKVKVGTQVLKEPLSSKAKSSEMKSPFDDRTNFEDLGALIDPRGTTAVARDVQPSNLDGVITMPTKMKLVQRVVNFGNRIERRTFLEVGPWVLDADILAASLPEGDQLSLTINDPKNPDLATSRALDVFVKPDMTLSHFGC